MLLPLLVKVAFWLETIDAQPQTDFGPMDFKPMDFSPMDFKPMDFSPMDFGSVCFNEHLSAAVDLTVKLTLANDGQCHLTLPLEDKFFVMGSRQAELFIASRLPLQLVSRILPRIPSIRQVTLDDANLMFWHSENSNHTIKLKIYTVNGETKKVHVLVENEEYELPEHQKSFNELLRKYPGLVYSLFKTFSEQKIPFVFDELNGELRVLINGSSLKPSAVQTVTLSVDGRNYSLPAQWSNIQSDTEHGLISQPAQLIQLLNEFNVTVPTSVLNVIKRHIKLIVRFSGQVYDLPADISSLAQVLQNSSSKAATVTELRDVLLISGALNSVEGSSLRIHHPYDLLANMSTIPLPLNEFNHKPEASMQAEMHDDKLRVRGLRMEFVLPGDEEKLKRAFMINLSPSIVVDAIRRAGFQVTTLTSNRLLIKSGEKDFVIALPSMLRRRQKLQLRIKGRPGRLTYLLILPDGSQLTLPRQWSLLRSMVMRGQIRFEKVLDLFVNCLCNVYSCVDARKIAKISVVTRSESSAVFKLNDELLQLDNQQVQT